MEIFRLMGSIFIDNEKANQSIDNTDKKGKSVASTLGSGIATAGKWGLAIAGGATVAAAGLFAVVTKTASAADEIDKLSERTGINREELQRWKYAAEQSGGDIDKLAVGMKTLSMQMDTAANGNKTATAAFEKLGISVNDLKTKSQEDIFTDMMNALGDMKQGAERNALGNKLLGKSYTELLPLLNSGSNGMKDLKDRADSLGLVMSEGSVKAGVKFGDTLDDLKSSFGAIIFKLGNNVMPVFQTFIDFILNNMPSIQATVGSAFEGISSAMGVIVPVISNLIQTALPPFMQAFQTIATNVLPPVVAIFKQIGEEVLPMLVGVVTGLFTNVLPPLANMIGTIVSDALPPFVDLLTTIYETVLPPVMDLLNIIVNTILPPFISLFTDIVTTVLPPLTEIFSQLMTSLLPPIIDLFTQIIETVMPPLMQLFDQFAKEILPPLMELIQVIIDELLPPIIDRFNEVANVVLPLVMTAFQAIQPVIEAVMKIISGVIKTVLALIKGDWSGAWDGIRQIFSGVIDYIVAYVKYFVTLFGAILKAFGKSIGTTWDNIWGGIKKAAKVVWDAISGVIKDAIDGIAGIFKTFKKTVGGIWDGIWDKIKGVINFIIGGMNMMINALNKLKIDIPEVDIPLIGKIGGGSIGFDIPNIPELYTGGEITEGGRVMVGEKGPEYLDLPKGAKVIPLDKTTTTTQGINNNFHIDKMEVRNDNDIKSIARELYNLQQKASRGRGLVPT